MKVSGLSESAGRRIARINRSTVAQLLAHLEALHAAHPRDKTIEEALTRCLEVVNPQRLAFKSLLGKWPICASGAGD
jgi:hypothetical protein